MKRLFLFFIGISIFLFTFSPRVYSETDKVKKITGDAAGLTCGVAGAEEGVDKCCSTQPKDLPHLPFSGVLDKVPFIGDVVDKYNVASEHVKELQSQNLTACTYGDPSKDPSDPSCRCVLTADAEAVPQIKEMCTKYLTDVNELKRCNNCADGGGLYSGFGCVPLKLQNFVSNFLLSIGINVAFLVALICIIYSAFMLQTSQGNPERLKKAREYLTSCIVGLILILFSVFLLRLIGVSILGIPGLS